MKFSVLQENLKQSLNLVQKAIPSKPQLPILTSIYLQASNDKLTLAATDLYFGVKTSLACKVEKPGSVVIPGDIFKKLIFSLTPSELEVSQTKKTLTVRSPQSKTTIPHQLSEDYPEFPIIKGNEYILTQKQLESIERYVNFSVSIDQARPILTAVMLDFDKNGLKAVGTDGFRLTTLNFEGISSKTPSSFLIPARALSEVFRIINQLQQEKLVLQVSSELKQILFRTNETEIFVRLIEGAYPPYQKIIPNSFTLETELDGEEFNEQLKRAAVFAQEASNIVKLGFNKNKIEITASTPAFGKYQGEMSLNKSIKQSQQIAFNIRYLLEFLNSVRPERLWFGMNESLKPAMFIPDGFNEYRYIIMPFRINE